MLPVAKISASHGHGVIPAALARGANSAQPTPKAHSRSNQICTDQGSLTCLGQNPSGPSVKTGHS